MDNATTAARDLFFLAILLVVAAYFVGFSSDVRVVTNAVSTVGQWFSGQVNPSISTPAAKAA